MLRCWEVFFLDWFTWYVDWYVGEAELSIFAHLCIIAKSMLVDAQYEIDVVRFLPPCGRPHAKLLFLGHEADQIFVAAV
jgi:hypothetical protein